MKVYIGPYGNWTGPYQIANWLQKVGLSEDRCDKIGEWLAETWVNGACEWIHSKQKRNIKIRIDNYDTWGMDHTLALIALPMLKQLKATKHGSPMVGDYFNQTSNSAQCSFDFYAEGDEAAWEAGHKAWGEILDHIIWSFEQELDENADDKFWTVKGEMDFSKHPEDVGKLSVPLRWKEKPVCDYEGLHAYHAKIQEGFELFGRYYQGLWD